MEEYFSIAEKLVNHENQEKLKLQLSGLGIRAGDVLLVHSSLHSVGAFPNKALEVTMALMSVLGSEGTLLMPGFQSGSEYALASQGVCFDLRSSPSELGYLTEYFRKLPGVMRSISPTHSISGYGRAAKTILSGHEHCLVTAGWGSPFERLIEANGKILLLGVGHHCNTTMHFLENTGGAPTVSKNRFKTKVIDMHGNEHTPQICPHMPGLARNYEKMQGLLETASALETGMVGEAFSQCFSAQILRDIAYMELKRNPCAFIEVFNPTARKAIS